MLVMLKLMFLFRKYSDYPVQQYGGYYDPGPHHPAPPPSHPFNHQDHTAWHQVQSLS